MIGLHAAGCVCPPCEDIRRGNVSFASQQAAALNNEHQRRPPESMRGQQDNHRTRPTERPQSMRELAAGIRAKGRNLIEQGAEIAAEGIELLESADRIEEAWGK